MNMKQLKYVLTLANEGSFSRAADLLNISQPSLSQYIKKIEKQQGVELFDRLNGNVRLTDAGRVYVDAGRKILDLERQMQTRFTEISQNKSGSVIVGTTPFRSATMMPLVVRKFQERYPGVCIVTDERGTQELLDASEKGEFDICLVTSPVDKHIFVSHMIMEEELVIAVLKGSKLDRKLDESSFIMNDRKYKMIDAGLLNKEAFVMVTETQIMQKALENLCVDYGLELKKAAVVKSLEAQIEMVRQGVGAALVPTGIKKFSAVDDKISFYSLKQELPRREVVVIHHKDKYISKIIQDLIDVMKSIDW